MRLPTPFLLLTLTILSSTTLAARSSATSFCKCVCFNNSTIIALNPPDTSSTRHASLKFSRSVTALLPTRDDDDSDDGEDKKDSSSSKHHKPTCADCNRAFCLNQGLKICQDAKETDVFAACFQRDSLKDELVVILFVTCTGGLLLWALIKPCLQKARDTSYTPLSFGSARRGNNGDGDAQRSARRRASPGPGPSRYSAEDDEADQSVLQSQSQSQSQSRR